MKIGFFTDAYFPQVNGVATSVENAARELRKRGHEVYIITARYPDYKDKKKDNIIRLSSILVNKKLNIRLATHFPEKELFDLYKIDFDIIHAHSGGTISLLGLEIASLKKIPFVFTYHTLWTKYAHYLLNGLLIKSNMIEKASRIFCNRCSCIIAPSEKIKKELLSYGVKKPIAVVPSGIDLEKFKNVEKGFLREKFKIKDADTPLLYVGRLGKEKSIDFLIKAFEIIAKKSENTVFVIVGDGPQREKLEELVKNLKLENKIYFTGNIPQEKMPRVYKDCDLFLFASQTETQGLVLLEAMASGLGVVAVDDPVVADVIKNNKNGIISNKDINEYAKSVLELLNDDRFRNKIAINAKKDAQKFSIAKTVDVLEKLYLGYVITPQISPPRLISVVVPAYNEEAHIESCLTALRKQNYKGKYEIILVDNNSTDKTVKIAKKFGVKVILEKRQGNTFALKRGMDEAKGDIIAATDADSQVRKNWLSIIGKAFANPDIIAVTGVVRLDSKSRVTRVALGALYAIFINLSTLIGKPNMSGFNFAVRKSAYLKAGGLNAMFEMSPDIDLGIRLTKFGKVKTVNNLRVVTSSRRWENRFLPTLWDYAKGHIYVAWLRKPPPVKQTAIR